MPVSSHLAISSISYRRIRLRTRATPPTLGRLGIVELEIHLRRCPRRRLVPVLEEMGGDQLSEETGRVHIEVVVVVGLTEGLYAR